MFSLERSGSPLPMQESDDSAQVWLLKVPGFLHEALVAASAAGHSGPVGAVVEDPSSKDGLRFELRMNGEGLRGKPSVFSVKPRPLDHLKAFSQDTDGQVRLVGSVAFKGDLLPAQGAAYADMLQHKQAVMFERVVGEKFWVLICLVQQPEAKKATEKVQAGGRRTMDEKRQMYKRGREEAAEARAAAPVQRVELTRDEMVTAILTLFEEQTHWSKREIMQRTRQAEKLVNDVLKELATLEAAGDHKNEFVLRDEFRIKAAIKKQKK